MTYDVTRAQADLLALVHLSGGALPRSELQSSPRRARAYQSCLARGWIDAAAHPDKRRAMRRTGRYRFVIVAYITPRGEDVLSAILSQQGELFSDEGASFDARDERKAPGRFGRALVNGVGPP